VEILLLSEAFAEVPESKRPKGTR